MEIKKELNFYTRQLIFWLLVFNINRIVFIAYYWGLMNNESIAFADIAKVFYHSFRLDLSTFAYIQAAPFVLSFFLSSKTEILFRKIYRVYFSIVIIIYQLISLGELQLYGEWKTKLSAKALEYLRDPSEVVNSATNFGLIFSLAMLIVFVWGFIWLYNKYLYSQKLAMFSAIKPLHWLNKSIVLIVLFWLLRGGFQAIPISASNSYFSKHDILNKTAVNNGYNMIFSIIDYVQIENNNIFASIDADKAKSVVAEMHDYKKDSTISIINTPKPNIVIVLLESWSGDMIESLGGLKGVTPGFHELEKDGLLFTNFYATANRSQQAMTSIFSGIPGVPFTTLSDHPEKYPSVKSLVKILNRHNYYTSYYFGGQLNYGNMKSFLVTNKFDKLVERDDIEEDLPAGKLGIHDEYMFDYFESELEKMPQPFFANIFTLSSHSPYDFPGERPFKTFKLEGDFVNSVHYTDKSMKTFFDKARKSKYWDNTLFIVLADHSHNSPLNHQLQSFEYHKIPLLLLGGALKQEFRGTQNNKLCSNVDITSTILNQLNIDASDFKWSKNIFNPDAPEFAYFELNTGFGWKRPDAEVVLGIKDNYFFVKRGKNIERAELEGRAYTQVWFDEFLSY